MTSEIKSIPNSSSAWSILSPLTLCYNYIKDARPLAPSPHAVTSVITPQSGSFISNTPPLLLVAGAAALLGTVYLIATKLVPYFFRKTPPPPPGNLDGKTTTVITPPPSENLNGSGTGLPPPPSGNLGNKTVTVIPLPADSEGHVNGANGGLPRPPVIPHQKPLSPPNDGSEDHDGSPRPPTVKPPSPPLISASSSPNLLVEDQRLPLDRPESRSPVEPLSPINGGASGGNNSKIPAAVPRSNSFVDHRPPLSSSPDSQATESTSSSESESDSHPVPPRTAEAKGGSWSNYVSTERDPSKWTKYRLIQEQLAAFTDRQDVRLYTPKANISNEEDLIGNAWNKLLQAVLRPTSFPTADDQYRATVMCLRDLRQLFSSADEAIRQKFSRELQFIRALAYVRFTVELYPYCCELLEEALHTPIPPLSFDNILEQIELRTEAITNVDSRLKMNKVACEVNRLKGAVNVKFDPLLRTIPYKDGTISANGKSVDILWHATPVTHHDPYGLILRILPQKVLTLFSYFPYVGGIVGSNPPTICGDYVSFIEGAEDEKKKILHVILENGDEGFEKPRVQTRLKLGVHHKNFYPVALRFDGKFFERHDLDANRKRSEEMEEALENLMIRFKDQLLSKLGEYDKDLTASVIHSKQVETQLKANGFCVPQKLRDESQLDQHIGPLLEEIQTIYFPDVKNITTVQQHQAFLILSQVHIVLFLCWKLNINILEALCKDDKDRGNVFKTILKLHFLYITGQCNQETFTAVLTHMLARPFIVQKGPIIPTRLLLLQHVIPIMKAAHRRTAVPKTMVFGQEPIQNPSYTVVKPLGQTIRPSNATSRTLEEYRAFLDKHTPVQLSYNGNLIQELSQEFYPAGERQIDMIMQRVSGAARHMNIKTCELLLMAPPNPSAEEERRYYTETVHTTILAYLATRAGLSVADAWKVSCSFQPSLGRELHQHLNGIFNNSVMGISVKLDEKSLMTPECGIHLTTDNNIARLKFTAIYNITDRDGIIRKIRASMTIADLATGHAQFEYALV